jgi:hypothetical protein
MAKPKQVLLRDVYAQIDKRLSEIRRMEQWVKTGSAEDLGLQRNPEMLDGFRERFADRAHFRKAELMAIRREVGRIARI